MNTFAGNQVTNGPAPAVRSLVESGWDWRGLQSRQDWTNWSTPSGIQRSANATHLGANSRHPTYRKPESNSGQMLKNTRKNQSTS